MTRDQCLLELAAYLSPTKCHDHLHTLQANPNAIAEVKENGWQNTMLVGSDLPGTLLTSGRLGVTGYHEKSLHVPHLLISPTRDLGLTVFSGEVVAPGAAARSSGRIMGGSAEHAERVQRETGLAEYVLFDISFYNGEDWRGHSWDARTALRTEILKDPGKYGLFIPTMVRDVQRWWSPPDERGWQGLFDDLTNNGGEGLILKDPTAAFGSGQAKWKVLRDITAIITGYEPGKNKYTGQVGSVCLSVWKGQHLVEIAKISGMTDSERRTLTEMMPGILSNLSSRVFYMLDVEAQEFGKNKLVHPRFKQQLGGGLFRTEYDPMDCTWERLQAVFQF